MRKNPGRTHVATQPDAGETPRFQRRYLAGAAVLAVMALASCMLTPHDEEKTASDQEVLFSGAFPASQAKITIQAYGNKWEEIGNTTSTSLKLSTKFGTWYVWSMRKKIPAQFWIHSCASAGEHTRVRSRFAFGYLSSVQKDFSSCYSGIDTYWEFVSQCTAPQSPVARVYTPDYRDFGKECVDRINTLRATEGLGPLVRHVPGECDADKDAKINYETGIIHKSQSGNAQNECPTYSSISDILDDCIEQKMFKNEKKCHQQIPNTCYDNSSCECGHYVNMTASQYKKVACALYETPSGTFKSVQNFYK
jgi:hypothetical protein